MKCFYIYVESVGVMFSPEFMKYLINYQKEDYKPEDTRKQIRFKNNRSGKLADILVLINK